MDVMPCGIDSTMLNVCDELGNEKAEGRYSAWNVEALGGRGSAEPKSARESRLGRSLAFPKI